MIETGRGYALLWACVAHVLMMTLIRPPLPSFQMTSQQPTELLMMRVSTQRALSQSAPRVNEPDGVVRQKQHESSSRSASVITLPELNDHQRPSVAATTVQQVLEPTVRQQSRQDVVQVGEKPVATAEPLRSSKLKNTQEYQLAASISKVVPSERAQKLMVQSTQRTRPSTHESSIQRIQTAPSAPAVPARSSQHERTSSIAITKPSSSVDSAAVQRRLMEDYVRQLGRHLQRYRRYPLQAQRRQQQGTVVLRIQLNRHGQVLAQTIVTSSGYSVLDQAAQATVTRAEPLPALPEGSLEQWVINLPVVFALQP
jgi:protein TonB